MDAAHPARMLVVDISRSRARTKLEGSTGGQRWWVIDIFSLFYEPRCTVSVKNKCSKRCNAILGEYPEAKYCLPPVYPPSPLSR